MFEVRINNLTAKVTKKKKKIGIDDLGADEAIL